MPAHMKKKTWKNKAFFIILATFHQYRFSDPLPVLRVWKPKNYPPGVPEKKKLPLSEAFVSRFSARRWIKTCKFPYFFAVKNIGNFQTKNMINFNKFWYIINILTLQHGRRHFTTFILFFMVDVTAYIPYFFIIFPYVFLFFLIFILILYGFYIKINKRYHFI